MQYRMVTCRERFLAEMDQVVPWAQRSAQRPTAHAPVVFPETIIKNGRRMKAIDC